MVAEAKKQDKLGVAGLIDYLDTAISPSSIRLTVTVAGRGDEGNLFLWQKKNDGTIERPDILDTDAVVSVASTAKYDAIYDRLIAELCKREGIEKAIQRTIAFASTIEDSICADYDLVKVSAGEGDESSAV